MAQRNNLVFRDGVPVMLTVEEAGELLRIGRTKAYAMAREWRETKGRSGLPVIDLGHVLRVPRQALEELTGSDFSNATLHGDATKTISRPSDDLPNQDTGPQGQTADPQPKRKRKSLITDQLDLFDSRSTRS